MKFLCPQCKAKYQIADEKIEGRTLRMKCRRCEFEITVRGDGLAASEDSQAGQPPTGSSPGRLQSPKLGQRTGGSSVGPAPRRPSAHPSARLQPPSALGADFRRQGVTAPPPPSSQRPPSVLDQWHVSIQDVPVGPMKREELARKIGAGAVTGDSLCWREGFDDWRPLKDIAELAPLLRKSTPPPGLAPQRPGAPVSARPGQRPSGPAPRGPQASRTPSTPGLRTAPAAARSNVVPIGGRMGASAAPAMDELDTFDDTAEPTRVAANPFDEIQALEAQAKASPAQGSFPPIASAPPQAAPSDGSALVFGSIPPAAAVPNIPASPMVQPPAAMAPMAAMAAPAAPSSPSLPPVIIDRRRASGGLSVAAWIAIVASGCFGITLAVVIGTRLLADKPTERTTAQAATDTGPRQLEAQVDLNLQDTPAATTPTAATPTETPLSAQLRGNNGGGARRPATAGGAPTPAATAAAPAGGGRQLSASEQALLDRMEGDNATFRPATRTNNDDAPAAGGAEMSAEQLRSVINRERPSVQHCYEVAARQTGSQETMRVNIHFVAAGGGRAQTVEATGGPDILNRCIEAAVRRWRFPGAGEATLPFVFSPAG